MIFNYTIIAGDTLWSLAKQFDTTVSILKSLNGLTSDVLNIGQILKIPSNKETIPLFQFGTWIPSLQIGNGIIRGYYTDQTGHWTRTGNQIFINGFFKLDYNETQVEDALRRNTTVQEIRIGTLPFESNNGASIFNLMISNNTFIQNMKGKILSVEARSIWGSPRMRIFANKRSNTGDLYNTNNAPLGVDLSVQNLKYSTYGNYTEIRVSGTYTAFPDLRATDPINTPPPNIIGP